MTKPHKSEGETAILRKNLFDDLWKLLMHEKAFRGVVAAFLIANLGVSTFTPFKHNGPTPEQVQYEKNCQQMLGDVDKRVQHLETQMAALQMYLQLRPLSLLDNSRRPGTISTNSN